MAAGRHFEFSFISVTDGRSSKRMIIWTRGHESLTVETYFEIQDGRRHPRWPLPGKKSFGRQKK
jgi:hypothetical protein